MSFKKIYLGILVTAAFSLSACSERTEVYEEKTTPVVVPDNKDIDINVRTEPNTSTSTTERTETTRTDNGEVTTETKTQTTN